MNHEVTPHRTGFGLSDYVQLRCTCGWQSRLCYEADDNMMGMLREEQRAAASHQAQQGAGNAKTA